jgi:hypothetical protein
MLMMNMMYLGGGSGGLSRRDAGILRVVIVVVLAARVLLLPLLLLLVGVVVEDVRAIVRALESGERASSDRARQDAAKHTIGVRAVVKNLASVGPGDRGCVRICKMKEVVLALRPARHVNKATRRAVWGRTA